MATAGLDPGKRVGESGLNPWGAANGGQGMYVDGQFAGYRAPDTVGGVPVTGGPSATPTATGTAATPASMQSLQRAGGVPTSSGGGYTPSTFSPDLENERIRQLTLNNGIANREDEQAFQKELAALKGQQSTDATTKDQDFQMRLLNSQQSAAKTAQDRMFEFVTPWLNNAASTPHVNPTSDADAKVAEDAAFARAKDRTADIARSSLMSLRASAAERGVNVAGGTNPALLASEGNLMAKASQPLSDLVRQQAIDATTRAQSVADRNYQGEITQAGQRMALAPSILSLLKVGGLY